MDVLSWNCRVIVNDATKRALKDLISQNRPHIVFLCETKISRTEDFIILHRALGFQKFEVVLSEGASGGPAMFWNKESNIEPQTKSAHHIDLMIKGNPGEPVWRTAGIYGYARTADRDGTWELLRDLGDLDSIPWIVIGDFNEILNSGEKLEGPVRAERQMRGFREALSYCDLIDMGYIGPMTIR